MTSIPDKVASRIAAGLRKFQPILESAHHRDVNESDTVVIVTDILHDVMGYDKYSEITSEHMIRSTFCDLAIKLDGQLALLLEVKAIGLDLKEAFVRQGVDYAANQGCEWVALTNGIVWRAYRVCFTKPVEHELIVEFDLCKLNPKKEADLELVWLLSKEGWQKSRLSDYATLKQALSRFTLAASLIADPCLQLLRRELRRVSPDARIDVDQIKQVLVQEVVKREVLEGEKADAARKLVARAANRHLRTSAPEEEPAAEAHS
jgi:hypothetical protein